MNWSKTLPTEQGMYWLWMEGYPCLGNVVCALISDHPYGGDGLQVSVTGNEGWFLVGDQSYGETQWIGPIEVPAPPVAEPINQQEHT